MLSNPTVPSHGAKCSQRPLPGPLAHSQSLPYQLSSLNLLLLSGTEFVGALLPIADSGMSEQILDNFFSDLSASLSEQNCYS